MTAFDVNQKDISCLISSRNTVWTLSSHLSIPKLYRVINGVVLNFKKETDSTYFA
jgi:hypothetical protein